MTWRWTACWMEGLRCGYRGVGSAVGAHGVYVHSVSWIRHLGMACGATFAGRCSHNLAAAAELPFASRPGDRTDRFRPTCCSSRCCSSPFNDLWPDSCISSKRTNEDTLLLFRVFIYSVAWILSMLSDLFLNHLAVLFIMAQFTAYETYCFTTQTHARTHTDTQANMLTCSSVTRKTATGCGLGTKTFSELSEDAWSREAPSQNVKHFWCQNRQAQALIWGEMMLKQEQHWRCIRPWRFACF